MARAIHRQPAEVNMDYVNLPESSVSIHASKGNEGNCHAAGRKLFRLVGVSFGLLCILQAALNVSLRLTLFKSTTEMACRNETEKQRKLIGQYIQREWVYFQTSLYYISNIKNTWQRSREFCQQQGADLVIINSKEEQDFTRKFHRLTWLGLHYLNRTEKWTWVDETLLTKSYWGYGEPNGYEGRNEHCVEIRFFETENSWNDIPCEEEDFWICEKKVTC